jgi:hypothetical protein
MRSFIPALLLAVPAVFAAWPASAAEAAFPLIRFFEGRTAGEGMLKVVLRGAQTIRVQSRGKVEPDGSLALVQQIEQQGKKPRTRTWRMREVSPGRFEGSLTDAVGPVKGEVMGNRFRVAYRMKGDLQVEQVLSLRADGRTIDNVMEVGKFGLTVATLRETIRKLD